MRTWRAVLSGTRRLHAHGGVRSGGRRARTAPSGTAGRMATTAVVEAQPEASASAHLKRQNLAKLGRDALNPLTPEVISRQATINFGTIGHVAHGKSTVVRAISGVQTVRFKSEKERNITIKLGYANAKVYKCSDENCKPPGCYSSYGSLKEDDPPCRQCGAPSVLLRHVSFVDCPGHDILMATMLNGAAVMDAALLLIAGNETCPQPQTSEHLAAVEIMRLRHIIILQNKVELIKKSQAEEQHTQIKDFIQGTIAQNSPIIPISAVLKYNVDVIAEYICTQIPIPVRDFKSAPVMVIIRSFDVNKPGDAAESIKGGVAGGSILVGILEVGQEVEIRPGLLTMQNDGTRIARPIRSKIVSLFAEQNDLQYAVPGGLIGVGTNIDPALTRGDRLVGQMLGYPGQLPDVYHRLKVSYFLFRRLLGVKMTKDANVKGTKVEKLKPDEVLMVNVGSTSIGARVKSCKSDTTKLRLQGAVCTKSARIVATSDGGIVNDVIRLPCILQPGDKIALSRRVEKHWRLIGWGEILSGETIPLVGNL